MSSETEEAMSGCYYVVQIRETRSEEWCDLDQGRMYSSLARGLDNWDLPFSRIQVCGRKYKRDGFDSFSDAVASHRGHRLQTADVQSSSPLYQPSFRMVRIETEVWVLPDGLTSQNDLQRYAANRGKPDPMYRTWGMFKFARWTGKHLRWLCHVRAAMRFRYHGEFLGLRIWPGVWVGCYLTGMRRHKLTGEKLEQEQ